MIGRSIFAWADKAAALASYAKQSEDTTLEKAALRIRARAIRRAGELLKAIMPAKGGDRKRGEPVPLILGGQQPRPLA